MVMLFRTLRRVVDKCIEKIEKMRWSTVYWLLISFVMFSSICSGTIRQKRNISFIKKLLSKHMGSTRYKCNETPQKPTKAYEVIVVPDSKSIVVEPALEITRYRQKNNGDSSFLKIVRQFISSATFQEVSQDLAVLINAMQSAPSSRVTDKIVEAVSEQPEQPMSQESLEGNRKSISVVEISTSPLKDEMIYERPKINDLSSLDNFVSFMIQMPRRYSYEQVKGQTVETFTLDNNSNVIVTEKMKTMPRPAHIDDRIKEVILRVPLAVRSNDNRLVNIQNQLNLKPSEFSNHVSSNKMEDNVSVNNANTIQTRYMYKQNTESGSLNFGGTSFVTLDQQDGKIHSTLSPNISGYTGKPIIVSSLNCSTRNSNTLTLSDNDSQVYTNVESNVKDEMRGDIPDSS